MFQSSKGLGEKIDLQNNKRDRRGRPRSLFDLLYAAHRPHRYANARAGLRHALV